MRFKRKSPIRHQVKAHTRGNSSVHSYMRGRGVQILSPFARKRLIEKSKAKAYTINFKYSNRKNDGESVLVVAKDYKSALDEAFEERKSNREPVEVEVIDPDLGRMLRTVGRGAAKAAYLGAKYSIRGVKALGKMAAIELAKHYKNYRVKQLVEKCYSANRVERIMARSKLKRLYPEIYRVCDFSKPGDFPKKVEKKVRVRKEIVKVSTKRPTRKLKEIPEVPRFPLTKEEARRYVEEAKQLDKVLKWERRKHSKQ